MGKKQPIDSAVEAVLGRPSMYLQEYCQRVIELGKQGKSIVQIASCLNVHKDTVYEWAKVHKDFSDALSRARQEAQVWWEDHGQAGLLIQGFNASLWAKQVSCRFPDDYRDTSRTELTGKNGGVIESKVTVHDMTDEELLKIAAGK